MIIPIGDTPNPRGFTPWVTWLLLAANALVYLLLTLPMGFTPVDPSTPGVRELLDRVMREVPPGTSVQGVLAQLSQWDLFVEQHGYVPGDPSIGDLFSAMFLLGQTAGAFTFGAVAHALGYAALWFILTMLLLIGAALAVGLPRPATA